MAARAGLTVDTVLDLWRTLGVAVPDQHRPMFSERDVSFTSYIGGLNPVGEHGGELLRVLGTSLARVAEAAVSVYVQTVQPESGPPRGRSGGLGRRTWPRPWWPRCNWATRWAPSSSTTCVTPSTANGWPRPGCPSGPSTGWRWDSSTWSGSPRCRCTPPRPSCSGMISTFETHAFEVASLHNGRIVKHIGDEVMFVALDAAAGCAIARDITAAYAEGIEPRGGVAFGEVITRHGDYYGTVVNLASRLAELAIPREVLVDGATAAVGRRHARLPPGRTAPAQGIRAGHRGLLPRHRPGGGADRIIRRRSAPGRGRRARPVRPR